MNTNTDKQYVMAWGAVSVALFAAVGGAFMLAGMEPRVLVVVAFMSATLFARAWDTAYGDDE